MLSKLRNMIIALITFGFSCSFVLQANAQASPALGEIKWSSISLTEGNNSRFFGLVHDGKNRYVAVARLNGIRGSYEIWESVNGYDWKPDSTIPKGHWLHSATVGNGVALVLGDYADAYYYSSKPGEWEKKLFPTKLTGFSVFNADNIYLFWFNNEFYVSGREGYMTSADGVNWSEVKKSDPVMTNIVSNGKIMIGLRAWDEHGSFENVLYKSNDGDKWEKIDINLTNDPIMNEIHIYDNAVRDINWNGKQFAVTGKLGVNAVSTDGETWTTTKFDKRLDMLTWNGEQYIATGFDTNEILYSSYDGLHYTPIPNITDNKLNTQIVWDGEKFIVAGDKGTVLIGEPASLIHVRLDGQKLKLATLPLVIEGSTMLPVRDIFNAVGADVTWDSATKTATGTKGGHFVRLVLDEPQAFVDGKTLTLNVSAQIVDNKLMVPARFVAEAFGYEVKWDDSTRTIMITTKKGDTADAVGPKQNEIPKEAVNASPDQKEGTKANDQLNGSVKDSADNLDYSIEKQYENTTYTYYLIKSKNNSSTLPYFKFVPGADATKFYNSITVNYADVMESYKFKIAQAVIEKEKGTTLAGLSEAVIQNIQNNKNLNGTTDYIPLTINGTKIQYQIKHMKDSFYSIEINF